MAKKKEYYGDITVLVKKRIRIDLRTAKKPTKETLLHMLEAMPADFDEDGIYDITDEETLKYVEVLSTKSLGKGTIVEEEV